MNCNFELDIEMEKHIMIQIHIIISYPDAGLGHCPEGQGPDIKHKF